jgi:hypothetical protein
MPALRYRCPKLGTFVEVWRELNHEDGKAADGAFDTVQCRACGGIHLVDPNTGRVAGADE